ncbi:hypothetical protein CDL12_00146 [Handroanthus impetiginosus]|uniref:DUF7054 domain-containing protein n=1 Tax=Handroanthus impetiginosus TaxID=429701 RepID=A0A2G9IBF8_9LAMI|nr:hypothetical protein CDL12_00146 [Handroanthus impetiginosus]
MSHRDLRRRFTANQRAISNSRAPRPSQSPSPVARRKIRPSGGGKLWRSSENVKVLKRSRSEPSLWKAGAGDVAVLVAALAKEEEEEAVLYRPQTCTDIFSSPDNSILRSPGKCSEGYNKDMKVVVNVTVEGSPGPIRTMVKLGSNIEETIKLVINKYNEEGRTPHLDKNAASTFELHQSYFSIQSLSKSDLIGDVGSRSFYLRKCSSRSSDSRTDKSSASSNELYISPLPFVPSSLYRKIKKIIQRTRRVWKFFSCIPCTG